MKEISRYIWEVDSYLKSWAIDSNKESLVNIKRIVEMSVSVQYLFDFGVIAIIGFYLKKGDFKGTRSETIIPLIAPFLITCLTESRKQAMWNKEGVRSHSW